MGGQKEVKKKAASGTDEWGEEEVTNEKLRVNVQVPHAASDAHLQQRCFGVGTHCLETESNGDETVSSGSIHRATRQCKQTRTVSNSANLTMR